MYNWETVALGSKCTVLQQGIINHIDSMNYRLNDIIYAKNGQMTLEKTKHKIGKVIPNGIYLDFLK